MTKKNSDFLLQKILGCQTWALFLNISRSPLFLFCTHFVKVTKIQSLISFSSFTPKGNLDCSLGGRGIRYNINIITSLDQELNFKLPFWWLSD